jgi:hypothetical protein
MKVSGNFNVIAKRKIDQLTLRRASTAKMSDFCQKSDILADYVKFVEPVKAVNAVKHQLGERA